MEKTGKLQKICSVGKDVVLGAAFLGFIGWSLNRTVNNYTPFTEEDYKNAKWYSSSATANEAYNFEKITHKRLVKDFYFEQVRKKNGSLENAHLYPDLDKNGKVAQ